MDPMTMALIFGGLGAYKGYRNEQKMADNDKFRKAAITYSPWTDMSDPGSPMMPGMVEGIASGVGTGAMVGNMFGNTGSADPSTLGETTLGAAPEVNAIENMKFTDQQMMMPKWGGQALKTQALPKLGSAGAMGVQNMAPPDLKMSGKIPENPLTPDVGPLEAMKYHLFRGNN